jgi:3-hydroxyisobutyrate dehydrogenase
LKGLDVTEVGPVGFIGLGAMGLPAATNLVARGFKVYGFSLNNLDLFAASGGVVATSAAEVAARCEVIIQCLPVAEALESVVYGPAGILTELRLGTTVIELSSYSLPDKERLRDALAGKGAHLLDCEMTARVGEKSMRERQGIFYISGDEGLVEKCKPIFDAMTEHHFYLGGFGTSLRLKTVANLLVAVNLMAAAEAMSLGTKAGIDPHQLVKLLPLGAGESLAFVNHAPRIADRMFSQNFAGSMNTFDKYFDLIENLADECGAATPLADVARKYFRRAMDMGHRRHHISSVYLAIEAETRSPPVIE